MAGRPDDPAWCRHVGGHRPSLWSGRAGCDASQIPSGFSPLGITTRVIGTLKRGLTPLVNELPSGAAHLKVRLRRLAWSIVGRSQAGRCRRQGLAYWRLQRADAGRNPILPGCNKVDRSRQSNTAGALVNFQPSPVTLISSCFATWLAIEASLRKSKSERQLACDLTRALFAGSFVQPHPTLVRGARSESRQLSLLLAVSQQRPRAKWSLFPS